MSRSNITRADELEFKAATLARVLDECIPEGDACRDTLKSIVAHLEGQARYATFKEDFGVLCLPEDTPAFDVNLARRKRTVKVGELSYLPIVRGDPNLAVALPDLFARSDLFPATEKRENVHIEGKTITDYNHRQIKFFGETFTRYDLRVYIAVLQACRDQAMLDHSDNPDKDDSDIYLKTSIGKLLKIMRASNSDWNKTKTHESLIRMSHATLYVEHKNVKNLLPKILQVQRIGADRGAISIRIPAELARLYAPHEWSTVQLVDARDTSLVSMVSVFYNSHGRSHEIDWARLFQVFGSQIPIGKFMDSVIHALTTLKATGKVAEYVSTETTLRVRLAAWNEKSFDEQAQEQARKDAIAGEATRVAEDNDHPNIDTDDSEEL